MIYHITSRGQKTGPAKFNKPGKYFTLRNTLMYFPKQNVVSSKRVNISYDDVEKLISFDPDKGGEFCITKSNGRAHIGIHSEKLKKMKKRMPQGAYIPVKWKSVPSSYRNNSSITKSHKVFKFDPELTAHLYKTTFSTARKFKKKRVSKKTRKKISSSLRAHYRGRRAASKK